MNSNIPTEIFANQKWAAQELREAICVTITLMKKYNFSSQEPHRTPTHHYPPIYVDTILSPSLMVSNISKVRYQSKSAKDRF